MVPELSGFLVAMNDLKALVNMSVRTVLDVAKLSAKHMLTTARVGDPVEDESMKALRPTLSKINGLGLVTTQSQMGVKEKNHWQRAYLCGFVSKAIAAKLFATLDLVDGLVVLIGPHGRPSEAFNATAPRLTLTRVGKDLQDPCTRQPLANMPSFHDDWWDVIPETGLRDDKVAMRAVAKDALYFFALDLTWGRKTWLFSKVMNALKAV